MFPERFCSQQHALSWSRVFFTWYNRDHRHSGTAMLTPEMVHRGQAAAASSVSGTRWPLPPTTHTQNDS